MIGRIPGRSDRRAADVLDALWDAGPGGTAGPSGLGPALAETVARVDGLREHLAPRPGFVRRLRTDLLATPAAVAGPTGWMRTGEPARGGAWDGREPAMRRRWTSRDRWWPPLEFAAAALLLFVLGAYLLGARELFREDDERVPAVPGAAGGTPPPIAGASGTAPLGTPRYQSGEIVTVVGAGVRLRPSPAETGEEVARLQAGTSLRIVDGMPIDDEPNDRWWKVSLRSDPSTVGYLRDDEIARSTATPTPTPDTHLVRSSVPLTPTPPPARGSDTFQTGEIVVVNSDDVNLRRDPSYAHQPIRVLANGEELVITGPAVANDGLVFWPVQDASGTDGYVVEEFIETTSPATTSAPLPTPTAAPARPTPTPGPSLRDEAPPVGSDLRFVEVSLGIDAAALAAGDETAIAALEADLRTNLSIFRSGQPADCRSVAVVVIAVGIGDAPDDAIAAAAVVETVLLRSTYPSAFAAADVLRFADAATPAGRLRLRVYYVEGCPDA